MTTDSTSIVGHHRGLLRHLALGAVLLCSCAVSITWAWNTVVTDVSGLARLRFAEGLAIAVSILLSGAVLEWGRRMAAGPRPQSAEHSSH